MSERIEVSPLKKTWILDLDGTLVKHNGYLMDGHDTLLPGIDALLCQITDGDLVIIVTSRSEQYRKQTEEFLKSQNIPYNHIVFNAPYGERILINDRKPSGLHTAIAINTDRDQAISTVFAVNPEI